MIMHVILWGNEQLAGESAEGLFKTEAGYYEKIDHWVIDYKCVDEEDVERLKQEISLLAGRNVLLVTERLSKDKERLIDALQVMHPNLQIIMKENGVNGEKLTSGTGKRRTYVPAFNRKVLGQLLVLAARTENDWPWVLDEMSGKTLIIGSLDVKSRSMEIMKRLFEDWQYIEPHQRVKLRLYSHQPLDMEMLCEVEDAAVQYLSEGSRFEINTIEIKTKENKMFYMIEAF